MLVTIILTVSVLVLINFLLLIFSSNKIIRETKEDKKPVILRREVQVKSISPRLAPTGS